ncbi:MAG: hypothetical protein JWM93_2682 [Frankiales bacterium]|nr:hypothetical protein [Frankiales bacterium]
MARHDEETQTPNNSSGKGRPTPKRSDAERGRRQPIAAPSTGKEAAKLRRLEAAEQRQRTRLALASGDEEGLPARDRGPIRRYVRDFVDARLSVSEWFLPVAVPLYAVALIGTGKPVGSLAMLAILALTAFILLELTLTLFQVKRRLKRKFPTGEATVVRGGKTLTYTLKGARLYAVARSTQMRRLRAPRPQVKRFQDVD